jgi:hypothetical protein
MTSFLEKTTERLEVLALGEGARLEENVQRGCIKRLTAYA